MISLIGVCSSPRPRAFASYWGEPSPGLASATLSRKREPFSPQEQPGQAGLHRLANPDRRLDAADPDPLGTEQARRERHLVSAFRRGPVLQRRQGRGRQGRPWGQPAGHRLHLSGGSHHRPLRGADCVDPDRWKDLAVSYTPLALDMLTYNGTTPQSVWPWLGLYPGQDLAYQGTAFVCAASYDLGSTASIGNHNFEIVGPLAGTGVKMEIDADLSILAIRVHPSGMQPPPTALFSAIVCPGSALDIFDRRVIFRISAIIIATPSPDAFNRNQRLFRVWLIALSQVCLNVVSNPC